MRSNIVYLSLLLICTIEQAAIDRDTALCSLVESGSYHFMRTRRPRPQAMQECALFLHPRNIPAQPWLAPAGMHPAG